MSVQLIISPPATGKTSDTIKHLCATLAEKPFAQVWVAVPDRWQANAYRRRIADTGITIGAHIGTFGDIYKEILDLVGTPYPIASGTITYQLIREIAHELSNNGKLPHVDPIRETPGFLKILQDRFAELKRALVRPEAFHSLSRHGSPILIELAYLFEAYQQRLQSLRWADPDGLSWLAVEALENDLFLLTDWELIIVDGFDAFTPAQVRTLQLLAPRAGNTFITLPGIPGMARKPHQRFRIAEQVLKNNLSLEIQHHGHKPYLPEALLHLERNLFDPNPPDYLSRTAEGFDFPNISMIETSSPAEETREALRWLKSLIVRNLLAPRECAIFTPDTDIYQDYIHEAASEFGLPVTTTWGEKLSDTPAITALINLLQLPIQDYSPRLTLDTIRSPFFDLSSTGLSPEDAHALELVVRDRRVVAGSEQWLSALDYLSRLPDESETIEDKRNLIEDDIEPLKVPSGRNARRLHETLKLFFELLTPPAPQSLEEWVNFVEDLLDEFEFYLICGQHVCQRLSKNLNDLSISASLTGKKTMDYRSFISILLGGLENAFVHTMPAADDTSVFIGRYIEARGLRFKAVAILGLAEGLFPSTERPDPFIHESLRANLGLEPFIGRHQDGLFYQAVTRSDDYLLLTRPYIAENGEPWEPSHFWTGVQKLFPTSVSRIKSEAARPLQNAASRGEALFWAIRQGRTPKHDPDLVDRARRIINTREILQARTAFPPLGPYEGVVSALSENLTHDFGEQHTWSASRLESFSKCSFMFFASNLLSLEEIKPPEPGFDPAQRGSMYHAILEETFRSAEDPTDLNKLITSLETVAREIFKHAPEDHGFRPSTLWQAEQDEMISKLEKTIKELVEQSQGWIPYKFEQRFGKTPATVLTVDTKIGPLKISGFIDRIDRKDDDLRIIDYKTGSSNFSINDLLEGFVLQLPVYALAAQEALNLGQVTHGFYWRINAAEPSSLKLENIKYEHGTGPQAAYKIARENIEQIVRHVRAGEFPPKPAKGSCPAYCVAAAWCWRYNPARF